MAVSLMILDDFLTDPLALREQALALNYDPAMKKGNYPGVLSTQPLALPGIDQAVSARIGRAVCAAPGTSHLHCRLTLAGDRGRSGVHIDPCAFSGILFLSRAEDCRGGTDFFRHKATGLDRVPVEPEEVRAAGFADHNALIEQVVNRDTFHAARWERVMRVPMRFNRLILFSPWLFHNSAPGFGTGAANGRLVQLLFFALAGAV